MLIHCDFICFLDKSFFLSVWEKSEALHHQGRKFVHHQEMEFDFKLNYLNEHCDLITWNRAEKVIITFGTYEMTYINERRYDINLPQVDLLDCMLGRARFVCRVLFFNSLGVLEKCYKSLRFCM